MAGIRLRQLHLPGGRGVLSGTDVQVLRKCYSPGSRRVLPSLSAGYERHVPRTGTTLPNFLGWLRVDVRARLRERREQLSRLQLHESQGTVTGEDVVVERRFIRKFLFQEVDAATEHPVDNLDDACPQLPACGENCEVVKDQDGCSCVCQTPQTFEQPINDTVLIDEAGKKICPEVKCDLHCERGLVMDENDCTFCKCRTSDSTCPPLVGCRKRCAFGYKTNKRGCPVSVASVRPFVGSSTRSNFNRYDLP